jgi:peroxiredoxin
MSQPFLQYFLPRPARCEFQLGQVLPDLNLSDTEGLAQTLSSYRGKPVVLAFIRLFDKKQYRLENFPYLGDLAATYSQFLGLGATLIVISPSTLALGKRLKAELALPMPVWIDTTGESFQQYGTGQALGAPLPAQFVLDGEGRLRFQHLFSLAHNHATPARLLWAVRNL